MTARRLSQFFTLGLLTLFYWYSVSGTNTPEPEFAEVHYAIFAILAVGIFGVLFIAMRFTIAGSETYWGGSGHPNELARIFLLIGTAIVVHLGAGWVFELQGRLAEMNIVASLLIWIVVPAAFVALKIVKLPVRRGAASLRRLVLVGGLGLAISVSASALKFLGSSNSLQNPTTSDLFVPLINLVAAAATEEVVFRFFLLTALLEFTRSRFNAVFLSSVVFGLAHAPIRLLQPVIWGDWSILLYGAQAYSIVFLLQTLIGIFLGILWLRTGSLSLVVAAHAIINVGPTFLTDF